MNILLRNLDPVIVARVDQAAAQARQTRQAFLASHLERVFSDPPIVIGWIAIARPGDEPWTDCPECGQSMFDPHAALLSDGTLTEPVCGTCANSE